MATAGLDVRNACKKVERRHLRGGMRSNAKFEKSNESARWKRMGETRLPCTQNGERMDGCVCRQCSKHFLSARGWHLISYKIGYRTSLRTNNKFSIKMFARLKIQIKAHRLHKSLFLEAKEG
jgi:hypothetical protein